MYMHVCVYVRMQDGIWSVCIVCAMCVYIIWQIVCACKVRVRAHLRDRVDLVHAQNKCNGADSALLWNACAKGRNRCMSKV